MVGGLACGWVSGSWVGVGDVAAWVVFFVFVFVFLWWSFWCSAVMVLV